jgi:(2Fe-2S) ferredoxin
VLCMGQYCNRGGQAEALYERLRQALGEISPAWASTQRVHWEIANCLSMCGAGPNLIVYPDSMDFHHVDPEALEAILDRLLSSASCSNAQL